MKTKEGLVSIQADVVGLCVCSEGVILQYEDSQRKNEWIPFIWLGILLSNLGSKISSNH